MDRGHVDRISRRLVTGWAADDTSPDSTVEVSILVNGQNVAQVPCSKPRNDLRQRAVFGGGRHGFSHEFSPPLPDDARVTVAVRHSGSGRLLGHGEAVIEAGEAEARLVTAPLPPDEQFTPPAPTDLNGLFRIFGLYDPRFGLYPLLCRLDFSKSKDRNFAYPGLVEHAAARQSAAPWSEPAARNHLNDLLQSPGFQQNVLVNALRAFPDKRRLLFVHIPKCAGSDLSFHLAARFPSIEQRLSSVEATDKDLFFQALADLAHEIDFSDRIFVRGHISLDYYADNDLIRPQDQTFTIVRDPIEVALSQVNYVITKIQLSIDSGVLEKDTEAWLRLIGLQALPSEITPDIVADYSRKILYNTAIVEPNSMCRWLGGGDAKTVIARLARHKVEVTDTDRYNSWLRERWGISAFTRQNQSIKYISLAACGHQDLVYLNKLSPEDLKLYGIIQQVLSSSGGGCSVRGEDLLAACG
jgi:hypothetical protein